MLAYLFLKNTNGGFDYKKIFLISMIPAVLSLAVFIFIKDKKTKKSLKTREPFWKNMKMLNGQLKLYILAAFLFTLGNSSNAFLLLRARSVGFSDTSVILLYFAYNLTASLLAIPAGKLSDRIGRKSLLVSGYIIFAAVYSGFAFAFNKTFIVALFILYGSYTAMIAGVERAYIAEISPAELKGTMLGLHSTVVGIALLPASAAAGFLWDLFGAQMPFLFGSFMSLISAFMLLFLMKGKGSREKADNADGA
jgi:MFS family permease